MLWTLNSESRVSVEGSTPAVMALVRAWALVSSEIMKDEPKVDPMASYGPLAWVHDSESM